MIRHTLSASTLSLRKGRADGDCRGGPAEVSAVPREGTADLGTRVLIRRTLI